MQQWVVTSKRADFKEIGSRFGIDQVTARIIRNRDVVGDEAIAQYLDGTLRDLADAHQMKDAVQLVQILTQKFIIESGFALSVIMTSTESCLPIFYTARSRDVAHMWMWRFRTVLRMVTD